MSLMPDQLEFTKALDGWVAKSLGQPTDWGSLLYALPSVYPTLVLESAERQSLLDRIRFGEEVLTGSRQISFATQLLLEGRVRTPHPQDASWSFADAALDTLLRRCERFASVGGEILLLGAPTLFHFAADRMCKPTLVLLDKEHHNSTRDTDRVVVVDLRSDQPGVTVASVVVADPPWYPSEMRAFLWTAHGNADKNAKILLSVPPVGTRPGVEEEWDELVKWAEGIGLRLLDYERAVLPYESPFFERNALTAAGIQRVPTDWRRGDLAMFECAESRLLLKPLEPCRTPAEWCAVTVGRVRLRLRTDANSGWGDPRLHEAVPDDILPSVSRRDRRLESVTVWTSGNRIFHCDGVSILYKIAQALGRDESPISAIEQYVGSELSPLQLAQVDAATSALLRIVETEEKEITEWMSGLNENVVELPSCKG
jgi:hypothetical protein